MDLTEIERAFLKQLSPERWISTQLFDHELVVRLVEFGLVEAIPRTSGDTQYRITAEGPHGLERITVQLTSNMRSPSQKLGTFCR